MEITKCDLEHYAGISGIMVGSKDNATSMIHAPFTLRPYAYPSEVFAKAKELAPYFNTLGT